MKLLFLLIFGIFAASTMAQITPLKPIVATIDGRNVDSMAIWIAPRKADSLVLLTEKAGGEVMVFKADKNATFVKRFGEMKRPNGIVVMQKAKIGKKKQDLAFITERDGNKISVFSVPDFEKLGEFGNDVPQPMGISLYQRGKDLLAFVVAKRATGNDKVIRFKITEENGKIVGIREKEFGQELTPNQETIFADEKSKLIYAADETAKNIKVYNVDGILQKTFGDGIFQAQVEGITIVRCGGGKDYLIASDQGEITEFEIFDLKNYEHRGTVVTTAKRTDGITATTEKLPDFPKGLFIAQTDPDDTGGLRAEFFDLKQLFEKVNLRCR